MFHFYQLHTDPTFVGFVNSNSSPNVDDEEVGRKEFSSKVISDPTVYNESTVISGHTYADGYTVINGRTLGLIGSNFFRSMRKTQTQETVTAMEDSERCDRSWLSWDLDHSITLTSDFATYLKTQVFVTLESVGEGRLYTECDGITRFKFLTSPSSITTRTVTVIKTQTVWQTTRKATLTDPNNPSWTPNCLPASTYCASKNYQFIQDLIKSADVMPAQPTSMRPFELACQAPPFDKDSNCDLWTDSEVMLFYWPPILTSRDICAVNGYGTAMTISQHFDSFPVHVTSAITFEGQDLYLLKEEPTTTWCTYGCLQTSLMRDRDYGLLYNCAGGCLNETTTSTEPTKTFKSIGPMTLTGPFTFKYPTIYLAHRAISRTVSRYFGPDAGVGPVELNMFPPTIVRNASVIPLRSDDIYSEIRTFQNHDSGVEYAQRVARGDFQPKFMPNDVQNHRDENGTVYVPYSIRSFDFGQLEDPVPASVYYNARFEDCWGTQSHCATITSGNYRPRLAIKNRVWFSLMPEHFSCNMRVLNDPPRAISTLPVPTLDAASIHHFEPAQPGANFGPHFNAPTALPNQDGSSLFSGNDENPLDGPHLNGGSLPNLATNPNNVILPTKTGAVSRQLPGQNQAIGGIRGDTLLPTKTDSRLGQSGQWAHNSGTNQESNDAPQGAGIISKPHSEVSGSLNTKDNTLPDTTDTQSTSLSSGSRLHNSGKRIFWKSCAAFWWLLLPFALHLF
jgi:hypothetical protein